MHVVSAQVLEQWKTLTDEQVVTRVLDGQTALFEVLMRRYNERVYRVARAIVRDDQEAEDVMQQAYVNAYAHIPGESSMRLIGALSSVFTLALTFALSGSAPAASDQGSSQAIFRFDTFGDEQLSRQI